jgi:hypothetical protein
MMLLLIGFNTSLLYSQERNEKEKKKEEEKGKIGQFEDAAKSDSSQSSSSSNQPSYHPSSPEEESIMQQITNYMLLGIFFQFPDENEVFYDGKFWERSFSEYPYRHPGIGMFADSSTKWFLLSFNGAFITDGDRISGYGGRLFVSPFPVINLQFQFTDLAEKLTTHTDRIRFYDVLLNYNRVKTEIVSIWWGLGFSGFEGPTTHSSGPALDFGMEFYPIEPVSLSGSYIIAGLKTSSLKEGLIRINVHFSRSYGSLGYQSFSIGSSTLDGVIIGGGMWF